MEAANVDRSGDLVENCFVLEVPQAGNSRWLFRSATLATAAFSAQKFMRHLATDIVHAFLPGPCILGVLAARRAQIPLIIGSRRSLPSQYRARRRVAGGAD